MKIKIFLILLGLIIITIYSNYQTELIIPDTSIRLRVIPNSNEPKDINIKEQVKTYLEKDIYILLKDIKDIDSARNKINENLINIENNINQIFNENNYQLPYTINFGNNYFPEKIYQGKIYPEGEYESLVISIGKSEGDNWWCVLFPNFCLIDSQEDVQYKSYFKELINKLF